MIIEALQAEQYTPGQLDIKLALVASLIGKDFDSKDLFDVLASSIELVNSQSKNQNPYSIEGNK